MDENEAHGILEALIDQYVREGRRPSLKGLDETTRAEAESLLRVAELVWEQGHGAPPLESDPVAAALGLVPDPSQSLDARALKSAMNRAGLRASEVARRLSARQWKIHSRDVFGWTTSKGADVPPALIRAIADVVGTSFEALTVDRGLSPFQLAVREVVQMPLFDELAERWARLHRTTHSFARTALAARVPTTVHRGDHPTADQMLASLETLVATLESEHPDDPQH